MPWLIVIILAYFLFAFVSLGDKYLLKGPPNPKTYTFYVGVLGILILLLAPFIGFFVPSAFEILLCLLAGAIYVFAILATFEGLEKFEASRIIPAIGGFLPIFTLALTYFFSGELGGISAFIPLVLGSILISWEPSARVSLKSLQISIIAALFFSLAFVLSKYVYLILPFWNGFIWIRIGAFLTVLCFIFFKDVRDEIFTKKSDFNKKTGVLFIFNQGIGAGAFILQNWAISLAPLVYLSMINALQGIQYIFLFILSLLFYKFLKEKVSKRIIFQKILAIILIGLGIILLTY